MNTQQGVFMRNTKSLKVGCSGSNSIDGHGPFLFIVYVIISIIIIIAACGIVSAC